MHGVVPCPTSPSVSIQGNHGSVSVHKELGIIQSTQLVQVLWIIDDFKKIILESVVSYLSTFLSILPDMFTLSVALKSGDLPGSVPGSPSPSWSHSQTSLSFGSGI